MKMRFNTQQLPIRIVLSMSFSVMGTWFGYAGACFVWGYIYSIGSTVITDELYDHLYSDVGRWGAIAGACSGLAIGIMPVKLPFIIFTFLLAHSASVFSGMIGGASGWKQGLIAYFGGHAVVTIGCALLLAFDIIRSIVRLAKGDTSP
ncbi:MAG: hypothetical protein WD738_08425 [Pirellulales bacterium]